MKEKMSEAISLKSINGAIVSNESHYLEVSVKHKLTNGGF